MEKIRMEKREVKERESICEFLKQSKIGYLGLSDESAPYVVPLNFVWQNDSIYFHGANEGRKVRILAKNNQACFTVCEDFGTIASPIPANTDTAYFSVIVFGLVEQVTNKEERLAAMQTMLDKYVPGYFNNPLASAHLEKYQSSLGSKTAVFKLAAQKITGKENKLDEKMKFTSGRTIDMDL
ncbi:pyridoxamine 5'-phosphate oxidase family protein [Niallia nealsonii]|uniref:Pyridoxamine 5'-phosphate oxidase family protein n=1 Tax=Niallia nealsonii TaxID=115979 RepID=A0A2N0YYX4_9BACI|nr:pyridoxamine 5'-phosphate oxidase family protein [Niallia nealsonii]PKG22445.1 pyridoxamine 5'-phosphate oxidase family protein [Niallia nealsonii]